MNFKCSYDYILLIINVSGWIFFIALIIFLFSIILLLYKRLIKKTGYINEKNFVVFSLIVGILSIIVYFVLSLPDYNITNPNCFKITY